MNILKVLFLSLIVISPAMAEDAAVERTLPEDVMALRPGWECPPHICDRDPFPRERSCWARDALGKTFYGSDSNRQWACDDAMRTCRRYSKRPRTCRLD